MKKVFLIFSYLLISVLLFSNSVICLAEDSNIPKAINIQGKLTTDSEQVLNGKQNRTFPGKSSVDTATYATILLQNSFDETTLVGDNINSPTTYQIEVATANFIASSGADLAEIYRSTEKLVPGDVVSIDTTKDNSIVKTKIAEDTLVAGVIATEPGLLMNATEKGYKLALVGKVPTKVCNQGGKIKRGDLLVSASLAGYAKKAGANPKAGTVIGKALQNFDSRKGTILVLVNLQ